MAEAFNEDYFKHYAFFREEESDYTNPLNHFAGNLNIHQFMLKLYQHKYDKLPSNFFDLGCGTGEEMAFYHNKGISVAGCDISSYVLERKNPLVADGIHEVDSISFLESFNDKADIILDSTLQYLEDSDFYKLLNLIKEHASETCVLGIIYDASNRNHPYRKQIRTQEEWNKILSSYGFANAENEVKEAYTNSLISRELLDLASKLIFMKV